MLSSENKFRAETLRIAGIALMTPLGRLVLENIKLFNDIGSGWFYFNFVISLGLFIVGLTFVERGRGILYTYRRFKNDLK